MKVLLFVINYERIYIVHYRPLVKEFTTVELAVTVEGFVAVVVW